MRIDLPQCGLDSCRYSFDGNCTNKQRYKTCEYAYFKVLEATGRLIEQKYATLKSEGFICSECGNNYMDVADADAFCSSEKPNFCPWCGAKFVSEAKLTELKKGE